MDKLTEPDSGSDKVGRKYLWNSMGWKIFLVNFR